MGLDGFCGGGRREASPSRGVRACRFAEQADRMNESEMFLSPSSPTRPAKGLNFIKESQMRCKNQSIASSKTQTPYTNNTPCHVLEISRRQALANRVIEYENSFASIDGSRSLLPVASYVVVRRQLRSMMSHLL